MTDRTLRFGGSNNQPLRGKKGDMFEGGVRVCAAVRYPAKIPGGRVCNELLTSLDVVPTLVKLASAGRPDELTIDGADILPVLRGDQRSSRTRMFWQRKNWRAARVGTWKYIRDGKSEWLFDLDADVGETINQATTNLHQLESMRNASAEWQSQMAAAEPRGPFRDY